MTIDFSVTIETLSLAMSVEETKARVAAYNIAMASRPGSKALQVVQQDPQAFAQMLGSAGMSDFASQVRLRSSIPEISIDTEVADMAMASGRYQSLADAVSRQFALMQLAIRGGR